MRPYPVPFNEAARIEALGALTGAHADVHGAGPDPVLDGITELVRAMTGHESALVSLVEADRQVFASRAAFPVGETVRDLSICAHVVAHEKVVVIEDARAHPVFRDHPVVTGPPHVCCYVGAPITLSNGLVMGSLCALGTSPRPAPPPDVLARLADLAGVVAHVLEERARREGQGGALDAAAARAQGEFLALVSHELRTPLNGIIGVADLLDPGPDDRDLVEALRSSGALLHRLIEHVIIFADVRAGKVNPREVEVPARDIVEPVRASLTPRLRAEGRPPVEVRVPDDLSLRCDPDMLSLALDCLASNALTHGAGGVRIVAGRRADGAATLAVEDGGVGVDDACREAVLEPFAHGAPLHVRAADGLGLGLPLTRRLVELHGGELALGGDRPFRAALVLPPWRVAGRPDA